MRQEKYRQSAAAGGDGLLWRGTPGAGRGIPAPVAGPLPLSPAGARLRAPRLVDVTELINVVGGAVVDSLAEPRSLLVARRTAPPQFAGMWEFPGGKVDPGELPEDALHRELREELGIEILLGPELAAEAPAGWPLNANAAMRVWFAELAAGTPQALEDHDELRWVALSQPEEVLGLPWIPADLPIVEALLAAVSAQPSPN